MHTTKPDRAPMIGKASSGSRLFNAESSLSERELIMMATDLSGHSPKATELAHRAIDVTLALAMLVVLLPLMALTALAIAITSPGPVIFRQVRIGMHGKEFDCLKFRSMDAKADEQLSRLLETRSDLRHEWSLNQKLKRDPRITPIGAILRQTSIDELPQLINVLRGDMSLVGPRPIVRSEVPKYGRYITTYLSLRPGLTGVWQVSGRNDLSYRRRVAADVWYSRSKSIGLDIKIMLLTIPAVITGEGSC